jgi:ubiquitin thioesterase protein OTUB1
VIQSAPALPDPRPQAELIGARQPVSRLAERYSHGSPALAARLASLSAEFPTCRAVQGDGNCFYRGFVFALLEALLEQPHVELRARY